ncbi:hypothetical protein CapIbe_001984 [Capra ibex]
MSILHLLWGSWALDQGLGQCPQIQAEWSRKSKRHLLGRPRPAWDPLSLVLRGCPAAPVGSGELRAGTGGAAQGPRECRVLCPGGGQGLCGMKGEPESLSPNPAYTLGVTVAQLVRHREPPPLSRGKADCPPQKQNLDCVQACRHPFPPDSYGHETEFGQWLVSRTPPGVEMLCPEDSWRPGLCLTLRGPSNAHHPDHQPVQEQGSPSAFHRACHVPLGATGQALRTAFLQAGQQP